MPTREQVQQAYGALATGDINEISKYWAADLRWLVPGHNILSGWKEGLQAFVDFMMQVGQMSENSFHMDLITVTVNDEYSTDITRNRGHRAGDPNKKLDITLGHTLRWRDGKVIEGKGGIFGDGTTQYDQFWSPVIGGLSE